MQNKSFTDKAKNVSKLCAWKALSEIFQKTMGFALKSGPYYAKNTF